MPGLAACPVGPLVSGGKQVAPASDRSGGWRADGALLRHRCRHGGRGILVDCGSWASPITPPGGPLDQAAALAAAKARDLVEKWTSGELKIAIYYDETGWRGHKLIEGGELPLAIEPVPVEIGKGARVIAKTLRRRDWRAWRRTSDGLWLECENSEA